MYGAARPGARRKAFNAELAESSGSFFNSKHRDVINSVEESIKRHGATSSKVLRKFATKPVKLISVSDVVTMTEKTISQLCGLGLMRYYTTDYMHSQSPDLIYFLEAYLTILAAFCTIAGIDEHSCPLAVKNYGCELFLNWKTPAEIIERFNTAWPELAGMINVKVEDKEDHQKTLVTLGLSTLLFLTKKLNANSCDPWFNNRWRAIGALLKAIFDYEAIAKPPYANCKGMSTMFSPMHKPRNTVFEVLRSLAGQVDNKYRAVFESLVRNMGILA